MRVAVAISPKATSPADTEPMKIVARLVDSAIAAARAPCRVKCSVVTNATAPGCGAAPPAPVLAFWSLLVVSPAVGGLVSCRRPISELSNRTRQEVRDLRPGGPRLRAVGLPAGVVD